MNKNENESPITPTTITSKEQREEQKNAAVETREQGKLEQALEMFKQVETWDEENNNVNGQMDVLGHIKVTYSRLAEECGENDTEKRKEYYQQAAAAVEKSIKIGEANPEIAKPGNIVIQKVHLASTMLDLAQYETKEREQTLSSALKLIDEAIENLPGSQAHKAWPANTKAKIQYELGQFIPAIDTLRKAELWIVEGYNDEIQNDDQAEIKLNVWLSGLHLTFAQICAKENMPIIARQYATSVIGMEDKNNILGERKKEAQRILNQLKSRD